MHAARLHRSPVKPAQTTGQGRREWRTKRSNKRPCAKSRYGSCRSCACSTQSLSSTVSMSASPRLSMSADLGLSPAAFGLGAGLFFIGYFLFEVPSNLILDRVGARLWIARVMITWGILSHVLRLRRRPEQLLCPALPARRGRGRLLPRRDPLPDLLVPEALSRPCHGRVHDRYPDRELHRRPALRLPAPVRRPSASRTGNGCSSWRGSRRCCSASSSFAS